VPIRSNKMFLLHKGKTVWRVDIPCYQPYLFNMCDGHNEKTFGFRKYGNNLEKIRIIILNIFGALGYFNMF
jgi:hypothetical protein